MRLRSGPHQRFMANGDSSVVATMMRRAGDHSLGGPREVVPQSNARHRLAISPSPGKIVRRSLKVLVSVAIPFQYRLRFTRGNPVSYWQDGSQNALGYWDRRAFILLGWR